MALTPVHLRHLQHEDWQCDKTLVQCMDYIYTSCLACDVTFLVGESRQRFSAHKIILISRSSIFYSMFGGLHTDTREITLLDTPEDVFAHFLRYLYTDCVELTEDMALTLLPVAQQYCVNHLVKVCEDFLRNMTPSSSNDLDEDSAEDLWPSEMFVRDGETLTKTPRDGGKVFDNDITKTTTVLKVRKHQRQLFKKTFTCNVCGKDFKYRKKYESHVEMHSEGQFCHKCDTCGNLFTSKGHLQRHLRIHTGVKKHRCDVCGKEFQERDQMMRHRSIHTGEQPHMCDICGRKFTEGGNMRKHYLKHIGEKPYICEICGKGYVVKYELKQHLKAHAKEKPYNCDICRKGFDEAEGLISHSIEHFGKKLNKCDICGKFYSRESALKVHRRIHTGEKPFKCDECGRLFTNSGDLYRHRKIHTGMKPYSCDICGKSFMDKKYLRAHIRVHNRK